LEKLGWTADFMGTERGKKMQLPGGKGHLNEKSIAETRGSGIQSGIQSRSALLIKKKAGT